MQTGFVHQIVGQTPLIKIKSLSDLSGCEIYGKAEFLNPGGSVKDRTALGIICDAEEKKLIQPGVSTLVEGTAGNTGIGLATLAAQKNYRCLIVMPNNQSQEKYDTLKALGAEVIAVPPCPFSDENHFYHTARKLSQSQPNYFWANQFENLANFKIHYETTGPEIYHQTNGQIQAFVASSGTGGTISGVSKYLKEQNQNIHILLADPMGSGLHSYIQTQEIKSTGSSMTEGIGIMRLTANFNKAVIDDSLQVQDHEMISMLYHLAKYDGLLVGTSAALNVFAAYNYALKNKNSGQKIVTILCDSALRYQSKIFNTQFLESKNLTVKNLEEIIR